MWAVGDIALVVAMREVRPRVKSQMVVRLLAVLDYLQLPNMERLRRQKANTSVVAPVVEAQSQSSLAVGLRPTFVALPRRVARS